VDVLHEVILRLIQGCRRSELGEVVDMQVEMFEITEAASSMYQGSMPLLLFHHSGKS
jgi:hypothetical protein